MRANRFLIVLFITTALFSCKKSTTPVATDENVPFYFTLEAVKNPDKIKQDVYANLDGEQLTAIIPYIENTSSLVATFNATNATVKVNGVEQVSGVTSNDFSKPIIYSLTLPSGKTKTYTVSVSNTGLPVFFLTTSEPVVSKEVYVSGTLTINPTSNYVQEKREIALQIKGRGNSTWDLMPKKPYRLKFTDKTKVLGLPSAKSWVLLANYSDKTLMRTSLAFDLGQQMMTGFTPHGIPVEVMMNGQYLGNYLLTEQMEVNENRVNINELKPANNSPAEITGGYFIEQDERMGEPTHFRTTKGLPMNIKSPETISDDQLTYIKGYLQETENVLFSVNFADPENGYAKYIDVNSFVNWFLIQELLKNQDAQGYSSIYFQKPRNGKLVIGPIWDFDLSIGNVDYSDATIPTGWWVKDGTWYHRLFQDPIFKQKVVNRWKELKTKEIPGVVPFIDKTQIRLNLSQKVNFQKWNILNERVWPNPIVLGTYEKEVGQIKSWLNQRIAWIDENLDK
ncbi:MAG: hypothetical protein JWQ25_2875 [Daejeonella sp.]|nr:hypothetical protein [Daejeonella sp.]